MTLLETARSGQISEAVATVAANEGIDAEALRRSVAIGEAVILTNRVRPVDPVGVGCGLRTKVNANIGSSPECMDRQVELEKLRVAVEAGADTVMDLSLGAVLNEVRQAVLAATRLPVGTVPIYQVMFELSRAGREPDSMTIEDYLRVLDEQGAEGVDFVTIHAGLTRRAADLARESGRLLGVVSRGGALLCQWMETQAAENPLFTHFDRILEVCRKHDMTISLGDGLRPGAVADASDRAQVEELITLGELGRRARAAGVQVMIEGPGHVPLDQVEANILLEKRLCDNAPFYILGPLVTDIAAGHDHIAGAIGGAWAAAAGADFLCYLTPAEHLSLPTVEDVRAGVMASRIAAHAGDMVKLGGRFRERDAAMSRARAALDWEGMAEHALDPQTVRERRDASGIGDGKDYCTMCGEFCSVKRSVKRMEKN
jgi:phosphomethylpyrimidine synthase